MGEGPLLEKGPGEACLSLLCGFLGSFTERAWSQGLDLLRTRWPHHLLLGSSMDDAKGMEDMETVILLNS